MRVQQENYSSACCIPHTLLSVHPHTPILRASSVTQQQLCSEDEAEHKTFLCGNIHPHAQTSTLFSLGSDTSAYLLLCSSSQTSVPGVSKGHSRGHNGYSLVWQKPRDFQLNNFQVKLINLHNIKISLALLYPTIQGGKQGDVGREHMCKCSCNNIWLLGVWRWLCWVHMDGHGWLQGLRMAVLGPVAMAGC